jgi:ParB/RepB/Spo0J family partition protein
MVNKPPPIKTNVTLERLNVEYVPHDSVKPNSYNPNRQSEHDFDLLIRSMREDGFTTPIIVHRESREIVDGEHRWRAAAELGMPEIPVVFVEMTPEQMRIATLRHNRARGSEDIELSAEVLRDLEKLGALEWAADSLKLSDAEIEKLLNDVPAPEALAGEEYSEAWEPNRHGEVDVATEESTPLQAGETSINLSASPAAIAARDERERRIAAAKTAEEREMAVKSRAVYRIALMYTDDEANIVRSVLGQKPAVKLLEMCRASQVVAV